MDITIKEIPESHLGDNIFKIYEELEANPYTVYATDTVCLISTQLFNEFLNLQKNLTNLKKSHFM